MSEDKQERPSETADAPPPERPTKPADIIEKGWDLVDPAPPPKADAPLVDPAPTSPPPDDAGGGSTDD
jgi:hypothetical protein